MWRFWNCVPRFVRQQFHGPRASAGVYVEEEKSEHDVEKLVISDCVQEEHAIPERDPHWSGQEHIHHHGSYFGCRFRTRRRQSLEGAGEKRESQHEHSGPWSRFHSRCRQATGETSPTDGAEQGHKPHDWWNNFHARFKPAGNEIGAEDQPHHKYTPKWTRFIKESVEADSRAEGPTVKADHKCPDWKKEHNHGHFWSRFRSPAGAEHHEHGDWWTFFRSRVKEGVKHSESEEGTQQEHNDWWKKHCHHQFWSHLASQHRALEAITWGASVVFGLQFSRKPGSLGGFSDIWKDGTKQQLWQQLLLRVAFSMPSGLTRSIVPGTVTQEKDADAESGKTQKKTQQFVADQTIPVAEDKKTLSEVMQEFESSCHQYAAVGSSVSGLCAADRGQLTEAVKHLQLACGLGHAPACFNLALCYEMGIGVEKDQKQAASYYSKAADMGHGQSTFNLALMTLKGEGGITPDQTKAIELLKKAAKQGLAQAQTYLGVYYTENDQEQQDFEKATSFFQAAASQNDTEAQYFLGICYENGWGVESSDEEAVKLYSSAAQLGHDGAMYNLAAFHEYGLGGLAHNEEEAMTLYKRSAEQGNESARLKLEEVEAKKAVSTWSEQSSQTEQTNSGSLRRSPHSSSPVFTDFVRESIAGMWSGELSAWFSSQSLHTSSKTSESQRPAFLLGSCDNLADYHAADMEMSGSGSVFPSFTTPHNCSAGLHRTSTMPELRMVSCQ